MPPPPRKRAPRALQAVPDIPETKPVKVTRRTIDPASRADPAKFKESASAPLGKNKRHDLEQSKYYSGPDMAPGRRLPYLPTPDQVPPKPDEEPEMEYPGVPASRDGHPEWQLFTTFNAEGQAVNREWRVRWVPDDRHRCKARAIGKDNKWQGNRCVQKTIPGGRVCRFHGGSLPNVKKAAQAVLARAALPAAERLVHMALKQRDVSDADRLKALIQILDRAGVEGRQTITVELKPWQEALKSVYSNGVEGAGPIDGELVEGVDYELDEEDSEDGYGQ